MNNLLRTHVTSGSFEIRKSRNEVLEAFLGTCVGVAIVDKKAGIHVVCSQTGGFFDAVMKLNLLTLKCDIELTGDCLPDGTDSVVKPTFEELDRAISQIQPIPQVALKIIRTMQSHDFHLADVAREIRYDQVISAHVLKMCNTAFINPQARIDSIDQALLILGAQRVYQFVLSSVMSDFFNTANRGYSMSKGGLYHHAVSTAIASEQISRLTGHAEPDIAYTAGLLHDIGKVLLDQYVASGLSLFYSKVSCEGEQLLNLEKSMLGITHIEAGARLAELWAFPLSLQDVVAHHERPEMAGHDRDLVTVVHLADLLVSRFSSGYELGGIDTDSLPTHLQRLGLNPRSLTELIAQIPWKFLDTPGFFQSSTARDPR